jgi:hypothetical protein
VGIWECLKREAVIFGIDEMEMWNELPRVSKVMLIPPVLDRVLV